MHQNQLLDKTDNTEPAGTMRH